MDRRIQQGTVIEGPTYPSEQGGPLLRTFELSLRGVQVEVCTLGASLTKFIVPSPEGNHDIVLGYKTPTDMYQTGNPTYLCAVVGRVANRIAEGRLKIEEKEFQLAINNEPNHLHGGEKGFSHRVWNAEIISQDDGKAVQFSLVSENGDQGYPGAVKCYATYSLTASENTDRVSLRLSLSADLEGDQPTPINLAQHSYFNLSRHDHPDGILDHKLSLPSDFYTPLDATSIPTREVKSLNDDTTMDWRGGRLMKEALEDFALSKLDLDHGIVDKVISNRTVDFKEIGIDPFGFDHNYVVKESLPDQDGLYLVATLEHETSKRKMQVRTSAPGVQLYTANYLSSSDKSLSRSKSERPYLRWQGVCLETQAYPDSVFVDNAKHPEFAKGKCVILGTGNRRYEHQVVYDLDFTTCSDKTSKNKTFCGTDSDGGTYDSAEVMWQVEGVSANDKSDWYDRASQYYEENCPETIDGVLGGFANISDLDLEGSRGFIKQLEKLRPGWTWSAGAAAECGAGIGRVSKGLLLPLGVPRCDLVESSARLLSAAPDYIGPGASRCRFYCQGLQNWTPAKNTYSIIWIQWVFCYLPDDDAVSFLQRCKEGLVDGGVICLKENTCSDTDFVLDRDDASVTRSVPYLLHLANQAGLQVLLQQNQTNFPEEIFPVPMIALAPEKPE